MLAGFYVQDDGRVNPVDATMALAKGTVSLYMPFTIGPIYQYTVL